MMAQQLWLFECVFLYVAAKAQEGEEEEEEDEESDIDQGLY